MRGGAEILSSVGGRRTGKEGRNGVPRDDGHRALWPALQKNHREEMTRLFEAYLRVAAEEGL